MAITTKELEKISQILASFGPKVAQACRILEKLNERRDRLLIQFEADFLLKGIVIPAAKIAEYSAQIVSKETELHAIFEQGLSNVKSAINALDYTLHDLKASAQMYALYAAYRNGYNFVSEMSGYARDVMTADKILVSAASLPKQIAAVKTIKEMREFYKRANRYYEQYLGELLNANATLQETLKRVVALQRNFPRMWAMKAGEIYQGWEEKALAGSSKEYAMVSGLFGVPATILAVQGFGSIWTAFSALLSLGGLLIAFNVKEK
jgi:hypothetical protein